MNLKKPVFILFFSILFLLSCDVSLQKRIQNTENTINDAKKINAQKYSTKEFNTAQESLKKAREAFRKDDKKKAARETELAQKNAKKAYYLAIDRQIKSEQKITRDSLDDAKKQGTSDLAPDQYNKAEKIAQEIDNDSKRLRELEEKLKKLKKK